MERKWPNSLAGQALSMGVMKERGVLILGGPKLHRQDLEQLNQDLSELLKVIIKVGEWVANDRPADFLDSLGFGEWEEIVYAWEDLPFDGAGFARADMVRTLDGFKLVEMNVGATIGGLVDASLPSLAGLYQEAPPMFAWADFIAGCSFRGAHGAIIYDESASEYVRNCIRHMANEVEKLSGGRVFICRAEDLDEIQGVLYYLDNKLEWIYPFFYPEQVALAPEKYRVLEGAIRGGLIRTPVQPSSRLLGSKALLAYALQVEKHGGVFSQSEIELLRRYIPRTLILNKESCLVAKANRTSWVLKPSAGRAGDGVVIGHFCDEHDWQEKLCSAFEQPLGHFILQEYCESIIERVHVVRGDSQFNDFDARIVWGFFFAGCKPCGSPFLRCVERNGSAVINVSNGAAIGPLPPFSDKLGQFRPA